MKIKLAFPALLLCLLLLPATTKAQKKTAPKKDIAIQLYSVRDLIGGDVSQPEKYKKYTDVLKHLGQMGYTAVEAANYGNRKFYGRTPQEFKKDVLREILPNP